MNRWEKLKQKSEFYDESEMSHTPWLTKVNKNVKNSLNCKNDANHKNKKQNYFNVSP